MEAVKRLQINTHVGSITVITPLTVSSSCPSDCAFILNPERELLEWPEIMHVFFFFFKDLALKKVLCSTLSEAPLLFSSECDRAQLDLFQKTLSVSALEKGVVSHLVSSCLVLSRLPSRCPVSSLLPPIYISYHFQSVFPGTRRLSRSDLSAFRTVFSVSSD